MENNEKYLNFPIRLLNGAFSDIKTAMDNIMYYAGFVHCDLLEIGNNTEKMKASGSYLGITYGNPKEAYKNGKMLYDSLPENQPMAGINKDTCFDFYKHYKTPDQIAVLLAFLAIKSIVGSKPYYKTNIEQIGCRMAGLVSVKEKDDIPEDIKNYLSRRKFDKIKYELQVNWNVNFYSYYTRGFYVSIDNKLKLDQLVFEAEKNRISNKQKEIAIRIKEARNLAMKRLNDKN